jgi:hypothetical protein
MTNMVQTDLINQEISKPGDAVRVSPPLPAPRRLPCPPRLYAHPGCTTTRLIIPTRTGRPQVELFGESKGVLVCSPGRPLRPWFTVPDGCYALVTRFGKDEDYAEGQPIWPAGFHFGPPWLKVEFLVTKQSVVFNMPVKGCKTADNVTVQINLAVVFRIMADESKGENPENAR